MANRVTAWHRYWLQWGLGRLDLPEAGECSPVPCCCCTPTATVTWHSLTPSLSCRGASGNQGDRVEFADVWRRAVYVSQMELVCFHMEATLFLCRVLLICP